MLVVLAFDSVLGEAQQTHDDQNRAKHKQDFVPPTLMSKQRDHTTREISSSASMTWPATAISPRSVLMGRNLTAGAGSMVIVMRTQVEETIEVIRPALQADGGDIVLRDVNEETGVVSVTLIGACVTCPASSQTLKAGIERIMRDRIDGVTEVINITDESLDTLLDTSLDSGAHAR